MDGSTLARRALGIVLGAVLSISLLPSASALGRPEDERASPISAAARGFDPHDGRSAARLVEAVTEAPSVPLRPWGQGYASADDAGGQVQISDSGQALLIRAEGRLGMTAGAGLPTADGSGMVVQQDVAPSTDVVTRAIPGGVQLVAVLADRTAPTRIPFRLDLPAGWALTPQPDGSVRVDAAGLPSVAPRGRTSVDGASVAPRDVRQPVATLTTPWAVDATGSPVATHFEVQGADVVQVVEPAPGSVFPITADPNLLWWAWTAGQCVASLAPLVFGATAIIGSRLVKIQRYLTAHKRLRSFVNTLGGLRGTLGTIREAALGAARGSVYKYVTRKEVLALTAIAGGFMNLLSDVLGIGSCASLLREAL